MIDLLSSSKNFKHMHKELIIFGTGDIAELAYYYFTHDSPYTVVAFTVNKDFISQPLFCSLPVVAFEEINESYNSKNVEIFIALSYSDLNSIRKDKYFEAKEKGFKLASYISSHATVLNENQVGENCFILENNTIQPYVTIGDNVTLWSGNHIGHHSIICDHVFVASHVVISGGATIGDQCFLGVNCTIRDHLHIDEQSIVGAGALVMENLPKNSIVRGNRSKPSLKRTLPKTKI